MGVVWLTQFPPMFRQLNVQGFPSSGQVGSKTAFPVHIGT
jgi:hypothetical protein